MGGLNCLQLRWGGVGSHPLTDGPQVATFRACGGGILSLAMGANAVRFKNVEGLPAFPTMPDGSLRRNGFADGAGETLAARRFFYFGKSERLF